LMALFRRGKREQLDDAPAEPQADVEARERGVAGADPADAPPAGDAAPAVPPEPAATAPPGRPEGPWDVEDAPEPDVDRLDLGALQVPVPDGAELRVEVSPEGQVYAVTLVRGPSTMQLMAFAAPRTEGIWAEVRTEIAAEITGNGGSATEVVGERGVELQAQVPGEGPGGLRTLAPARFIGVDGPRWFLRAMLVGPAATDREAAAELEQSLSDVVVVRGAEAMVVRDLLPLRLPREVQEAAEQHAARAGLSMPERGPEITEVR
jgi:hypothetical protein